MDSAYLEKMSEGHLATIKPKQGHSPGGHGAATDTIRPSWTGGLSIWSTASGDSSTADSPNLLVSHPEGSSLPLSEYQSEDSTNGITGGNSPPTARSAASLFPINTKGRIPRLSTSNLKDEYAMMVPVLPSPKGAHEVGEDERQTLLHCNKADGAPSGVMRNTLGHLKTLLLSYKPQHITHDFGQVGFCKEASLRICIASFLYPLPYNKHTIISHR